MAQIPSVTRHLIKKDSLNWMGCIVIYSTFYLQEQFDLCCSINKCKVALHDADVTPVSIELWISSIAALIFLRRLYCGSSSSKPQVPLLEIVLLPHVISKLRRLAIDNAKLLLRSTQDLNFASLPKKWGLSHITFGTQFSARNDPNAVFEDGRSKAVEE